MGAYICLISPEFYKLTLIDFAEESFIIILCEREKLFCENEIINWKSQSREPAGFLMTGTPDSKISCWAFSIV